MFMTWFEEVSRLQEILLGQQRNTEWYMHWIDDRIILPRDWMIIHKVKSTVVL